MTTTRSLIQISLALELFFLWAFPSNLFAWEPERKHRRTSQIFARSSSVSASPFVSRSASLSKNPSFARRTLVSPSMSLAPSTVPTEYPTQSPTQFPTFSAQHFLDTCADVATHYNNNTCDCSTEDNSVVCELPGSTNFPFQYVVFEYNDQTGRIEKGSECYCENENSCGNNAGDYCLSMTLVGEQNCAIKFLQDGAQCSNRCIPCIDDMNTYGVDIDGCFSGGKEFGCISLKIEGVIGGNHNRSMAPPDFMKACDDIIRTYPGSECRCYVDNERMDCPLDNTTDFDNVFLSFLYDSNLTAVTDGLKCFCESEDCGASASDYCIQTALTGEPVCNIDTLQSNELYAECCDVCNSDDFYGVNTDQCYATITEPSGCFIIDIDKTSGDNHALGTSAAPSMSSAPSSAPSISSSPSTTPSGSPSSLPSLGPSVSTRPTGPPVPNPTSPPTLQPTSQLATTSPTLRPSKSLPVPNPTSPPMLQPTSQLATTSPTLPPSKSPARLPTNLQNQSPTAELTRAPTAASVVQLPRTTRPTETPTNSPSSFNIPTTSPTSGPTGASTLTTIFANGDTYVYKNGFIPQEPVGNEADMLVQNGPVGDTSVPDTYALVSFTIDEGSSLLGAGGSASRSSNHSVKVELCLQHVPNSSQDVVTTTYSLCRLNLRSSEANLLDVDNMSGSSVSFSMPNDCVGGESMISDFEVAPQDTEICIDVTESFQAPIEFSLETRHLEPEDVVVDSLLFMIDNLYTEQQQGDRFFTTESGRSPKIIINTLTSAPTPSPQPTIVTQRPTLSVAILKRESDEDNKKKSGLYSLFLMVLLIPIAWTVMKERKRQASDTDGTALPPSQLEIALNDPETNENLFGDEDITQYDEETCNEPQSIHSGIDTRNLESTSILDGHYAFSEGDTRSSDVIFESEGGSSESEDSDSTSDGVSTVDWEADAKKLVV